MSCLYRQKSVAGHTGTPMSFMERSAPSCCEKQMLLDSRSTRSTMLIRRANRLSRQSMVGERERPPQRSYPFLMRKARRIDDARLPQWTRCVQRRPPFFESLRRLEGDVKREHEKAAPSRGRPRITSVPTLEPHHPQRSISPPAFSATQHPLAPAPAHLA